MNGGETLHMTRSFTTESAFQNVTVSFNHCGLIMVFDFLLTVKSYLSLSHFAIFLYHGLFKMATSFIFFVFLIGRAFLFTKIYLQFFFFSLSSRRADVKIDLEMFIK